MIGRHPTTEPTTAQRAELARYRRTHRESARPTRRSARKRPRPLEPLPPAPVALPLLSWLSFLPSSWQLSSWPQVSPLSQNTVRRSSVAHSGLAALTGWAQYAVHQRFTRAIPIRARGLHLTKGEAAPRPASYRFVFRTPSGTGVGHVLGQNLDQTRRHSLRRNNDNALQRRALPIAGCRSAASDASQC